MAINFLEGFVVSEGAEFEIPKQATHYDTHKKRIRFFCVNPSPRKGMKEIPEDSSSMSFPSYREHAHWVHYGNPKFRE